MSALKNQVERLAKHYRADQIEFGSFDYQPLLEGMDIRMNYDADMYFSDAIPSLEIRCRESRLLGTCDVVEESVNLLPGCLVARLGFIPVGTTCGGDIYALDCESGKVYELSHEKYSRTSISPGWKRDFSDFLPDLPITRENVINTAEQIFNDIGQFLDFLDHQDG